MCVFISLLMVMSHETTLDVHVLVPWCAAWWAEDFLQGDGQGRFLSLLKFLHFLAPYQADKYWPKTRIEPFFELLCSRSQTTLSPGMDIAVDKVLILWKGRLGFK